MKAKNILIILGHPDKKALCGHLADKYEKGAKASGAAVRRINLGDLKFDPILWRGYAEIQKLEPDLVSAQKDIKWAEHLVFIYPNWWGNLPALAKGFFDRAFLPGFAYKYEKGIPRGLLKKKSVRIIITAGSPKILYRLMGSLAEKALNKSILRFCGAGPAKITVFGRAETANKKTIAFWLKKVHGLGRKNK